MTTKMAFWWGGGTVSTSKFINTFPWAPWHMKLFPSLSVRLLRLLWWIVASPSVPLMESGWHEARCPTSINNPHTPPQPYHTANNLQAFHTLLSVTLIFQFNGSKFFPCSPHRLHCAKFADSSGIHKIYCSRDKYACEMRALNLQKSEKIFISDRTDVISL